MLVGYRATGIRRWSSSTSAASPKTPRTRSSRSWRRSRTRRRASPQFTIAEFGGGSANKAINEQFGKDLLKAGAISLPVTLAILLLTFGALVAAGIPLLLALTSVFAAIGLLALPSKVLPMDDAVNAVVLLIGLAVGVDYSMFYLKREREERAAGRTESASVEAAAATSGRSVLISGFTVIVAMSGMFISGDKTFEGFAAATMLVVAISVLGSLTVLPALLSKLGDRVNKGRVPFLRSPDQRVGESRFWGAIVERVMRRPLVSGSPGSRRPDRARRAGAPPADDAEQHGVVPTVARRRQDLRQDPEGVPRRRGRCRGCRRGSRCPLGRSPCRDRGAEPPGARERRDVPADRGRRQSGRHRRPRSRSPIAGNGTDSASKHAVQTLRDDLVPATVGRLPDATTGVGGMTANSIDFEHQFRQRTPYVFAFVFALTFVLMLLAFRSIVIAVKAIVLNALSVAAAYGILVLVFQDGIGRGLIGASSGGIESFMPMFLFVILFGLSMDYHVFILSRIREGVDHGMSTDEAVEHGIKTTAGVVTSAALVMVLVFSVFITLSFDLLKQFGVGLAAAVLIDATIIRGVLLPASMKLLGDWNWYLPSWLEWLPRVAVATEPEPIREDISGAGCEVRKVVGSEQAARKRAVPGGAQTSKSGLQKEPAARRLSLLSRVSGSGPAQRRTSSHGLKSRQRAANVAQGSARAGSRSASATASRSAPSSLGPRTVTRALVANSKRRCPSAHR